MALLEIKNLHVHYGTIKAVQGIDFEVRKGEIITLIGANGAGKSTTMKSIMGLERIASGSVRFDGKEIANISSHNIVKSGLCLVPEGRQVFPRMSVQENLEMGAYTSERGVMQKEMKKAYTLFPRLEERKHQSAGTLSGGEQQMLAVARALMARPRLLMLDEPSLGLAPLIVQGIFDLLKQIRELGITILLVEQNARMALKAADRGYVLETGKMMMTDTGANLLQNDKVLEYFLGGISA